MRLLDKVARLEENAGLAEHARLIVCTVRARHEAEDKALALAHTGVAPGRADLVVTIRKFNHDATHGTFVPMVSVQPCL
jgi:hypothetical protein